MAERHDLLLEIGTEELPSSELHALGVGLAHNVRASLDSEGLAHGEVEWFATPRRLAVRVRELAGAQAATTAEHRGPPVSAAFGADGQPTKAAEGFARRHGVAVADLERRDAGKAEYLFHTEHSPGRPTVELLPELADRAARDVPAKKRMRWGTPGVTFPRPVHWTVLLYGEEFVDAEILGVRTARATRGHRFHHPARIELDEPRHYETALRDPGHVVAGFDERAAMIRAQVEHAAHDAGGEADLDPDLLTEVTSLVEWPVALAGRFDARFLEVPPEALVAVMKDHQKYFPVYDRHGALLPVFVTVSNIDSAEPEVVRTGNERVIAPRLADAEFFWQQDRKRPLESRLDGLRQMVFQRRLGTLHDRSGRIAALAGELAGAIGADADAAQRAGWLAKCDLLTEMVGEFPELQGIMGGYYARHDGEPETVARAIADHYRPAFAGDALPRSPEGMALSLADRLDALVGLFAIGRAPSGDKDPFALRRAALGVLRILVEGRLDLDLAEALALAAGAYGDLDARDAIDAVFDFMMDRLKVYYAGASFPPDLFEAVRARRPTRPLDFDARMRAVRALRERPEAASLAEANKRIRNILRKNEGEGAGATLDAAQFTDGAERALGERVDALAGEVEPLLVARDYESALARLADLAAPLDRFFDDVMVMTDDARLRANRIALLDRARALFLRVADLSQLQAD